jgi:hypothetical protein
MSHEVHNDTADKLAKELADNYWFIEVEAVHGEDESDCKLVVHSKEDVVLMDEFEGFPVELQVDEE